MGEDNCPTAVAAKQSCHTNANKSRKQNGAKNNQNGVGGATKNGGKDKANGNGCCSKPPLTPPKPVLNNANAPLNWNCVEIPLLPPVTVAAHQNHQHTLGRSGRKTAVTAENGGGSSASGHCIVRV